MKRIFYLLAFLVAVTGCQKDEITGPENSPLPGTSVSQEDVKIIPGHIRVKLKPETPEPQVVITRSGGVGTGIQNFDLSNLKVKAYQMKRVFPDGKYPKRLRAEGMHLWYDIYFDEEVPTRSAVTEYVALPEIDVVEEVYEMKPIGALPMPEYLIPVMKISQMIAGMETRAGEEEEVMPFNDPQLPEQWHYHNTGKQLDGSIAGADVNAFQAWKVETGSPNVIVAVMDGGIQYNHPDLEANMWINQKELNGMEGVDDDGNGYIDDFYGFNFVTGKKNGDGVYENGAITQYEHGTHCAGTISAVNNNKRGVCGIAGGSGKNDGVRLMSCQIFHTNGDKSEGSTDPNMYVYAADNGAVISQNSWTGGVAQTDEGFLNSSLKEAIDYFIKYAGCGEDGQQLPNAPMKGGMVLFAAANDNTDVKAYPAAYEKNLRVAAMGPAFKKAVYSNYGDWIDLTAPGGEQNLGEKFGILSTSINSGYSWLQGTSMACPHASGCAALILSKFQGSGYTVEDLRDRIMNTLQNIDQYNPGYIGKLGKGYIDVGIALTPATTEPPVTTELKLVDSYDDWAIFEWKVMTAADGPIIKYELSWSPKPIVGEDNKEIQKKVFDVRFKKSGDIMRDTVLKLELGQTYYYTLQAIDRWGNVSEFSPEVSKTVVTNQIPRLKIKWEGQVVLDEGDMRTLEMDFTEPEGQQVTLSMLPAYPWVKPTIQGNLLTVAISPDFGNAGVYHTTLTVKDQYGKSASVALAFEVYKKVVAPIVIAPVADVVFNSLNQETTIDLNAVFRNPSHAAMIFEVTNADNTVAWVQRKDASLVITSKKNGVTNVQVRAINESNLMASTSFNISVQSSSASTGTWTTYPDAVSHDLTIILSPELRGTSQIRLYNAAGKQMIAREVSIGEGGYSLDMSSLSRGVYVLTVEAQGQRLTKNIIKI